MKEKTAPKKTWLQTLRALWVPLAIGIVTVAALALVVGAVWQDYRTALMTSQTSRMVSLRATVGRRPASAATFSAMESSRSAYSSSRTRMLSAVLCTTSSICRVWLVIRAVR